MGLGKKSWISLRDQSKTINLFSNNIKRVNRISIVNLLKQIFFYLKFLTIKTKKNGLTWDKVKKVVKA